MSSVVLVVDVAGEAAGIAGQSRTFPFTKISGASPVVTLSLSDTTGITSYFWEIVSKPSGSTAVLSDSSVASPTFSATADKDGTYLIRCTVNGGQSYGTIGVAFLTPVKGLRKVAAGETTEFDSTLGWAAAINDAIDGVESTFAVLSSTLDLAYDGAGSGAGRLITVDSGAVQMIVPDTYNTNVLELTQNDTGNDYSALKIENNASLSGFGYTGATPGGTSILLTSTAGANQVIWSETPLMVTAGRASGGTSLFLASICPDGSDLQLQSNASSAEATLDIVCSGASDSAPSPSIMNIGLTNDGTSDAQLSITSMSTDGDANIYMAASNDDGSGTAFMHLGDTLMDSFRFSDGNMRYSTWSQTDSFGLYIELSAAQANWDTFKTNFGEVSIIEALNTLFTMASP